MQNSSKGLKNPVYFVPIVQKTGSIFSSLVHIDFRQQFIQRLIRTHLPDLKKETPGKGISKNPPWVNRYPWRNFYHVQGLSQL